MQQSAPVFFLAGSTSTTPVTRTQCTVRAGQPIFFPLINLVWAADPGDTEAIARAYLDAVLDQAGGLQLTVDSVPVPIGVNYRVQSPVFNFQSPPEQNALGICPQITHGAPGQCHYRSTWGVSDGYWVMLQPLSPGTHVIHFEGAYPGFSQNITYALTVR